MLHCEFTMDVRSFATQSALVLVMLAQNQQLSGNDNKLQPECCGVEVGAFNLHLICYYDWRPLASPMDSSNASTHLTKSDIKRLTSLLE